MNFKALVASAALAVTLPLASLAAPFAPGSYKATDYNDIRSIWTRNSEKLVEGGGATNEWSVGTDGALFVFDALTNTAQMIGRAFNTGGGTAGTDLVFDFVLDMALNPGGTPFNAWRNPGEAPNWALFTLTGGQIAGAAGTSMAGVTYNLTQKSPHGPQAGIGANDKDANELGFSMWYMWNRTDSAVATTNGAYTFNTFGSQGDFNMDLEPTDPNLTDVPLPAAGWLLIAALGGMAAARRRAT